MAGLQLKNIEKRYANGFVAVSDFNLEVEDKEIHHICRSIRMWEINNLTYDCRA